MSALANYQPANTTARITGPNIVLNNCPKDKLAAAKLRWMGFHGHRDGEYQWTAQKSGARCHLLTILFPQIAADRDFWRAVAAHLQACIDGRRDYHAELGIAMPYRDTGWDPDEAAINLGIPLDQATRLASLPYPY